MIPPEDPVEVCLRRLAGLSREAQPFDWACDQVNLGNAWLDRTGDDQGENVERALVAYYSALKVFTREETPYEWAMTHMDLAAAFNQYLRGSRADSLERAISCGEAALAMFTVATLPVETAETLLNLSSSYRDRMQGDRSENLERAIAACDAALALPGLSTWLRGALRLNLGIAFQQRVQGDRARNLEEAISHYEASLQAVSPESAPADWALRQMNLAAAFSDRIEGDRRENLEHAIQGYLGVLAVLRREADPVTWAVAQLNLGAIWEDRVAGERRDNLEQAIGCFERALEVLTLEETPDYRATAQMGLGNALFHRLLGPRAKNLERAIACYREALEVRTREASPRQWAAAQEALGNAFGVRVRGERAENLEEAIACLCRALEVRTRETAPAEWAGTMSNLGVMYVNRVRGDRADNLEEAIRLLKEALEVRTREALPREWASSMLNLGMAWRNRTLGDPVENLEAAITCFEQSLKVRTRDVLPLEWGAVQMNLGIVLSRRLRGDRAGNLEDAIAAYRRALEVWTPEAAPADHAVALMNLGTAYLQRIHGEPAANLEEAIATFEGALEIQTKEALPADWATAMVNLGSAYSRRVAGERAENLERAIACYRGALEVRTREAAPVDWALTMLNLGATLTYRLRGDRGENLEEALEAGRAALEVLHRESVPAAWAFVHANLGFACSQRLRGEWRDNAADAVRSYRSALEVMRPESLPGDCRRVASLLGALLFAEERWAEAVDAYRTALQAAEVLYQSSLLWTSQAEELAAAPDLYRNAAFCLVRAGLVEEAAVTLERGRARNLSAALARDQAGLAEVAALDPTIYGLFREAASRLRALEAEERLEGPGWRTGGAQPLGEGLRDSKRQARMELDAATSRIRSLPGHGDFLREPDLAEILRAARTGQPLIYLSATPVGSLGLIVAGGSETPPVESLVCPLRSIELEVPWDPAALPGLLAHLGEALLGPLAARLRELRAESVVLIACGPLGLLPLHAARYGAPGEERDLLDEFEISYTPSAGVLNAARAALASRPVSTLDLVGVGNPLPPPAGLPPLPGAEAELGAVAALFPSGACRTLYREEATREAFLAAAPAAARIHLGCHGEFDAQDPLRSALHLAGGEITLREILGRPPFPAARLVVLSACRTAVAEAENLPDEVLGLPAGILQAGVPGVIGSLWRTDDLATLLLMVRFWEVLEADGSRGELKPARALRRAQRWLRDATAAELLEWARLYRQEPRGHPLAAVAAGAVARFILYDLQERPFGEPSAWAPFVFLGA